MVFLSKKITSKIKFDPKNDNRSELLRFTPKALKANYKIIEILKEFSQSKKALPSQIALAYLLAKDVFKQGILAKILN